jgi:hypothetical protein
MGHKYSKLLNLVILFYNMLYLVVFLFNNFLLFTTLDYVVYLRRHKVPYFFLSDPKLLCHIIWEMKEMKHMGINFNLSNCFNLIFLYHKDYVLYLLVKMTKTLHGRWGKMGSQCPFRCPNTLTNIIRNNFSSRPLVDGRHFLCGRSVYLFLEQPNGQKYQWS